ncbi:MAG: hypothetical protein QXI42_10390 [Thermoproteota archaeon]|nr:hypothetical protein [Candidatus Brockarchaeota archaeon]
MDDIEKNQKDWMKKSVFEIDLSLIPFDTKRVMQEEVETDIDDNMGVAILKRLEKYREESFGLRILVGDG